MKVKVSGLQCPIAMTLDMDVAADPADLKDLCKETVYVKVCKFIERASMNYQILDEKLSAELQVKNGEASMLFHIEQTYPWGVTSSPSASVAVNMAMSGQVDFTLKATDFKGQDHSIKGSQDFTVNMSLSGSSDHIKANQMVASVKESAQYLGENSKTVSNFSANLSVNGDQSQESYTIDGETVTADIYASERDKFANSMIAFGKKDNEGTHEPPDPIPSPVRQPGEIPPPPTDPPTKVKALQSQHGGNKL